MSKTKTPAELPEIVLQRTAEMIGDPRRFPLFKTRAARRVRSATLNLGLVERPEDVISSRSDSPISLEREEELIRRGALGAAEYAELWERHSLEGSGLSTPPISCRIGGLPQTRFAVEVPDVITLLREVATGVRTLDTTGVTLPLE